MSTVNSESETARKLFMLLGTLQDAELFGSQVANFPTSWNFTSELRHDVLRPNSLRPQVFLKTTYGREQSSTVCRLVAGKSIYSSVASFTSTIVFYKPAYQNFGLLVSNHLRTVFALFDIVSAAREYEQNYR